jgi:hypothetical protein
VKESVARGSMNFGTTPPGGFMGKREPQTILRTDERSIHLGLRHELKFERQIKQLGQKNRFSSKATSSRSQPRTAPGCSRICPRGRSRRPNCSDAIFRTTETALRRWCHRY